MPESENCADFFGALEKTMYDKTNAKSHAVEGEQTTYHVKFGFASDLSTEVMQEMVRKANLCSKERHKDVVLELELALPEPPEQKGK